MTAIRYHMRRENKEIADLEKLKKILRGAKHITVAMAKEN